MIEQSQAEMYERLILNALKPLIRELLLVDVANLIAHLTFEQHHQIADLFDSASEQFFAPGFVGYREVGSAKLDWNSAPSITFEIVLNAPCHSFEFSLLLENAAASISILAVNEHSVIMETAAIHPVNALKRAIELNTIRDL